jgi:hypothetical protein
MRAYESNGYLDRTKGHAYTTAKNASTSRAPNRRPPRFNQQVVSFGAGAGGAMQLQQAGHAAAAMGMGPPMRDYDQMEHGMSYDHFGNGFSGANRCISVAPDTQHCGGDTQHSALWW